MEAHNTPAGDILRRELDAARELVEAFRALARQAQRDLEEERREAARLRLRVAELERVGQEGVLWCTGCSAYKPESRYDTVVHLCADCVEAQEARS